MDVEGDGQSYTGALGGVSTVAFNGKLYIFYNELFQPWDRLHYAVWDGSKFTYQVLDGAVGGGGGTGSVTANLQYPAAVAAPDGLRVYYYDETHGVLREAYSKDGNTNCSFANLDGTGQNGSMVGNVGLKPSAIVLNGTVNVFYEDRTDGWLRMAQRSGNNLI